MEVSSLWKMEYPDSCSTAMRHVVRKVGLYVLEVTPPWECSFWTSGLAYDKNICFLYIYLALEKFDYDCYKYSMKCIYIVSVRYSSH